MIRVPISRVAIKIRKSISKEYCSCWNMKTFVVNGYLQFCICDDMSLSEFKSFLDSVSTCCTIHLTYKSESFLDKAKMALGYGIPVALYTKEVLPVDFIQLLGGVPHSAIFVPIDSFIESASNPLGNPSQKMFSLREMLFLAKSLKIFVGATLHYKPYSQKMLDIYTAIEIVKSACKQVFVTFPEVPDEVYKSNITAWESSMPGCKMPFKKIYAPVYESRNWDIKYGVKREFLSGIHKFCTLRKIGVCHMSPQEVAHNRLKYSNAGANKLPLGIKPFYYSKITSSEFIETTELMDEMCPTCGKDIFA